MSREYKVMASSMIATYSAGRFIADSPEDACEQARTMYRNSPTGRSLRDEGSFRYYTVSEFPYERECREESESA